MGHSCQLPRYAIRRLSSPLLDGKVAVAPVPVPVVVVDVVEEVVVVVEGD